MLSNSAAEAEACPWYNVRSEWRDEARGTQCELEVDGMIV